MAKVLLERETVEGDAVNALLDNEWDAILSPRAISWRPRRSAMPRRPHADQEARARMSEEELAADAAAFAQAAMQEDAEATSDDAGDDHVVNAGGNTDADK